MTRRGRLGVTIILGLAIGLGGMALLVANADTLRDAQTTLQ